MQKENITMIYTLISKAFVGWSSKMTGKIGNECVCPWVLTVPSALLHTAVISGCDRVLGAQCSSLSCQKHPIWYFKAI